MASAKAACGVEGNPGAAAESLRVADTPQFLTLAANRDRTERVELVFRRAFFTLIFLALLAGLLNVFGQRPTTSHAATSVADLEVFAPEDLRGGLYYEGRITVDAKEEIDKVTLVFDSGWTEQMQINTVEPSPVGEASRIREAYASAPISRVRSRCCPSRWKLSRNASWCSVSTIAIERA